MMDDDGIAAFGEEITNKFPGKCEARLQIRLVTEMCLFYADFKHSLRAKRTNFNDRATSRQSCRSSFRQACGRKQGANEMINQPF